MADDEKIEKLAPYDVLIALEDSLDDVLLAAAGLEVESSPSHSGQLILCENASPGIPQRFRVTVQEIPNE